MARYAFPVGPLHSRLPPGLSWRTDFGQLRGTADRICQTLKQGTRYCFVQAILANTENPDYTFL